MENFDKNDLELFHKFASDNGWTIVKTTDPYMISFEKGKKADWNRINIWTSERRWTYTVGTYLTHPKKGKTQLFRKGLSEIEIGKFFKNPRHHSGKGYYRK